MLPALSRHVQHLASPYFPVGSLTFLGDSWHKSVVAVWNEFRGESRRANRFMRDWRATLNGWMKIRIENPAVADRGSE